MLPWLISNVIYFSTLLCQFPFALANDSTGVSAFEAYDHSAFEAYDHSTNGNERFLHFVSLVFANSSMKESLDAIVDNNEPAMTLVPAVTQHDKVQGDDLEAIKEMKDMSDDTLYKYFTNGLGVQMMLEPGCLFQGIIETPKRKASFLDNGKWHGASLNDS
jgi:hypothetical protein